MSLRWWAGCGPMVAQETPAAERLKVLCEREGLALRELARELNVPVSTLQHYWGPGGYKGEKLPTNKPYLKALREVLMTKLIDRRPEVVDLFPGESPDASGLLWQELHALRLEMAALTQEIRHYLRRVTPKI